MLVFGEGTTWSGRPGYLRFWLNFLALVPETQNCSKKILPEGGWFKEFIWASRCFD